MAFLKWVSRSLRRPPSQPLRFPTTGFEVIGKAEVLEEERFAEFRKGQYCPVHIGDVLASKYQVIGKLGFGTTSTVWLARNMEAHQYAALKIYTRGTDHEEEFTNYQLLAEGSRSHPGYGHVRTALDTFVIERTSGNHRCLVQKPMWDSWKDLLYRNPTHRFTEELLKPSLMQLFLALDFLHTECRLIHTDIKADNILQEIADSAILESFSKDELENPSPRKSVDGHTIYASRQFDRPRTFGLALLSDFGAAVRGDEERHENAQPNVYRSPEVMLQMNWGYPIDIWNVGVMIWDIFEGRHMFYGHDPVHQEYRTRAHLAEIIAMLGPPPIDLLERGSRSKEFFAEDGRWIAGLESPRTSLGDLLTALEGQSKDSFLSFMHGMLRWRPEDRKTAKELLEDPWLNS